MGHGRHSRRLVKLAFPFSQNLLHRLTTAVVAKDEVVANLRHYFEVHVLTFNFGSVGNSQIRHSAVGYYDVRATESFPCCRQYAVSTSDRPDGPARDAVVLDDQDAVRRTDEAPRFVDAEVFRRPAHVAHSHMKPYVGERVPECQASAEATARLAITPIRCFRYLADACTSELRTASSALLPVIASTEKSAVNACSIMVSRNTPDPAPVTATRIASLSSTTITPTMAKRDARFGNFMYAALLGMGNETAVTTSLP